MNPLTCLIPCCRGRSAEVTQQTEERTPSGCGPSAIRNYLRRSRNSDLPRPRMAEVPGSLGGTDLSSLGAIGDAIKSQETPSTVVGDLVLEWQMTATSEFDNYMAEAMAAGSELMQRVKALRDKKIASGGSGTSSGSDGFWSVRPVPSSELVTATPVSIFAGMPSITNGVHSGALTDDPIEVPSLEGSPVNNPPTVTPVSGTPASDPIGDNVRTPPVRRGMNPLQRAQFLYALHEYREQERANAEPQGGVEGDRS